MKSSILPLALGAIAFAQTSTTTRPVTVATQYDGGIGPHQNLFLYSQDFSQSAWNKSDCGGSSILSSGITVPPGGNAIAQDITRGASSCSGPGALYQQVSGNASGQAMTFSIWARTVSSTGSFTAFVSDGTHTITSSTLTATTTWQRFFVTGSGTFTNTGNLDGGISLPTSGQVLVIWGAQLEQGVAAPRAYVSTAATAVALSFGSWSNGTSSTSITIDGTACSLGGTCNTSFASQSDSIQSAHVMGTDSGFAPKFSTAADIASITYVSGGGTAQAQTATYVPSIAALTDGLRVCWKPTAANTATAPTFSPNGLTAHTVVKAGGAALVANDLITTAVACAIYDTTGTQWELTNPQSTTAFTQTIASGSAAMGTSAIASGACATVVTVTATGAASTDVLTFSPNASIKALTGYAPVTTGGLIIYGYTGSNTANWDVCNPTSSSITPSAVTLNWRITR